MTSPANPFSPNSLSRGGPEAPQGCPSFPTEPAAAVRRGCKGERDRGVFSKPTCGTQGAWPPSGSRRPDSGLPEAAGSWLQLPLQAPGPAPWGVSGPEATFLHPFTGHQGSLSPWEDEEGRSRVNVEPAGVRGGSRAPQPLGSQVCRAGRPRGRPGALAGGWAGSSWPQASSGLGCSGALLSWLQG